MVAAVTVASVYSHFCCFLCLLFLSCYLIGGAHVLVLYVLYAALIDKMIIALESRVLYRTMPYLFSIAIAKEC